MRAFAKQQAPAPWPWDMVRYCLEMPHGAIRHFPAGTYNEQMQTATGRLELEMMSITHSAWYAFKHLSPSKWGDNERRLAKWIMPSDPVPIPPTRLLDYVINRLWRGSDWLQMVMLDLRENKAMANVIDILINASWTGGSAVKGAGTDLRGMSNSAAQTSAEMAVGSEHNQEYADSLAAVGTQAPKTGVNLAGLATKVFAVTAAITAVTLAAKKGFAALEAGAEIELTERRFDRLAKSIGTTGEALRRDLRIATHGLVSDMEALASATDFLALGLVDSHDGALRLTNVASQLGFDMNQLVLTLTNMTTMRFDALGVQVTGFQRKVEDLTEAGHSAEEAFKLAFLEQAEEQIERVGSVADTTAGKIDILAAAFKDLKDEVSRSGTEGISPLIEDLSLNVEAANQAEAAVKAYKDSVGDLAGQAAAVEQLTEAIRIFDEEGRSAVLGLFPSLFPAESADRIEASLLSVAAQAASMGDTFGEQLAIMLDFGFTVEDGNFKLANYTFTMEEFQAAVDAVNIDRIRAETEAYALSLKDFTGITAENSEEMEKLAEAVEKLDLRDLLERAGLTTEEFTRMQFAMGGFDAALQHVTDNIETFEAAAQLDKVLEGLDERIADRLQDRADLFIDFQDELTQISFTEAERRSDIEASSEERRTEIVERHGERRARDEEDWARSRLRQQQRLQRDIEGVNEDTADRAIELREDTDQRLEELERDHLGRIADIISNADLALEDAAARLDAAAVVSITRQREAALKDERDDYAEQRDSISQELQVRLKEEREAAAERIEEMKAFHAERQRIEAEDRQIRLDRQAQDHEAQLDALDAQHVQRLNQIMLDAAAERMVREDQYGIDRTQLVDDLQNRADVHEKWMGDILDEERAWWEARMDLVPEPARGGDIPLHLLQSVTPAVPTTTTNIAAGAITIPVTAADGQSPAAVAENVATVLEDIFGMFQ